MEIIMTTAGPAPMLESAYAALPYASDSAFIWLEADLTRAEGMAHWVTRAFAGLILLAAIFLMWI
jgi:hypothetical protein